ncbi:MAG: hypothetical protein HZA16_04870 [Nitrospirae bacterium]|nr:hypothetical protein [Nitrospirota bacterium]
MARVQVNKIPYGGWKNCVRISNDIVDLIVTADVGPRIIRYGITGKENELCEVESTLGLTGGDEWRIYGGHRLWHSPEDRERTYVPDNFPVQCNEIANGIHTVQDTELLTGIKKEMMITLSPDSPSVKVVHRLTNKGLLPAEMSVWAITAMATGGKEIIPQGGKDTGLLPNRVISLWPYTKINDPRVYWGERYIILKHDPRTEQPFKLGLSNEKGWAAYFNRGRLFVKYYKHLPDVRYPDFGASYESYLNDFMLEMETLSPLTVLAPDSFIGHEEQWGLFDNVPEPPDDEAGIEQLLRKVMSGDL